MAVSVLIGGPTVVKCSKVQFKRVLMLVAPVPIFSNIPEHFQIFSTCSDVPKHVQSVTQHIQICPNCFKLFLTFPNSSQHFQTMQGPIGPYRTPMGPLWDPLESAGPYVVLYRTPFGPYLRFVGCPISRCVSTTPQHSLIASVRASWRQGREMGATCSAHL